MASLPPPSLPAASMPIANPVAATLAGIMLADGSAAAEADVALAGVLVFRGTPGAAELWDEGQKAWRAAPPDPDLAAAKPLVAMFKPGGAPAWDATLVAIGQKDATGADRFKPAQNGQPTYFLRGMARVSHGGVQETAVSPPSAAFTFTAANANSRFATDFQSPETTPDQAEKVRIVLKGAALQPAGYLEIRAQPAFEVEIVNFDGSGQVAARVLLAASGDIRLHPAAARRVIVEGTLETDAIFYQPSGGGAKRWLA